MSAAKYFGTDVIKYALSFCRQPSIHKPPHVPPRKEWFFLASSAETRRDGTGRVASGRVGSGRDEATWDEAEERGRTREPYRGG